MTSHAERTILGIEGGGTRTTALLARAEPAGGFTPLQRALFGCGNVRLLADNELRRLFEEIHRAFPSPSAIGFGLAGARNSSDRGRVENLAQALWPGVPFVVTHDLRIALEADESTAETKILVLSGTGSCCYGIRGEVETKAGGWGHVLGDIGSGYELGYRALRAAVYQFDRARKITRLARKLLLALQLNDLEELIAWVQQAPKRDIAGLAPAVFEAARFHDRDAINIIEDAARSLASDALLCAARLRAKAPQILLAGGVLVHQQLLAMRIRKLVQSQLPAARVEQLKADSALGAVRLATAIGKSIGSTTALRPTKLRGVKESRPPWVPPLSGGNSPTEQRNPRSLHLHKLSVRGIVDLMLTEEKRVVPALQAIAPAIAHAATLAAQTIRKHGRIFYVGAGTSGRLGVLDASECPPTFRVSPDLVQGIIAGGQRAIWQAVEGAEDDYNAGAASAAARGITRKDFVLGIAASGRTPFVWGALATAQRTGAKTALLAFNPELKVPVAHRPEVLILANVGPEILTGSTRLKSGTATKLVLNMISTIAMVQNGKVVSNLMVDLNPSNVKLRDRAVRILQELTGCDAPAAEAALQRHHWRVKPAWAQLKRAKGSK